MKDILNFCNAAVFYDYKNVGKTEGKNRRTKSSTKMHNQQFL